jgi:hypothetical protein
MHTDNYVKAVLTIIAVCLVYLSLGRPGLAMPAQAQTRPDLTRVLIAGWVDAGGVVRQFPVGGSIVNRGLPVETITQK